MKRKEVYEKMVAPLVDLGATETLTGKEVCERCRDLGVSLLFQDPNEVVTATEARNRIGRAVKNAFDQQEPQAVSGETTPEPETSPEEETQQQNETDDGDDSRKPADDEPETSPEVLGQPPAATELGVAGIEDHDADLLRENGIDSVEALEAYLFEHKDLVDLKGIGEVTSGKIVAALEAYKATQ